MNAQEAREKAEGWGTELGQEQYTRIKSYIERKVREGQFELEINEHLFKITKDWLVKDGFNIEVWSKGNSVETTISW